MSEIHIDPRTRDNGVAGAFPFLLASNPAIPLNVWTNCTSCNRDNELKMPKILIETKGIARNESTERAEPANATI
jgi:hypothetical protein